MSKTDRVSCDTRSVGTVVGVDDVEIRELRYFVVGFLLREGRADVAVVHSPYDVHAEFDSAPIFTEEQVAILPAAHPLARRSHLNLIDVLDVPDLPIARWPEHDGSYLPGPGPEVHTQSQLAQLVSLGRALLVIPASSRAWQWPDHVAVPVVDAPPVTTLLAWPRTSRSPAVPGLVDTAVAVGERADQSRKRRSESVRSPTRGLSALNTSSSNAASPTGPSGGP